MWCSRDSADGYISSHIFTAVVLAPRLTQRAGNQPRHVDHLRRTASFTPYEVTIWKRKKQDCYAVRCGVTLRGAMRARRLAGMAYFALVCNTHSLPTYTCLSICFSFMEYVYEIERGKEWLGFVCYLLIT